MTSIKGYTDLLVNGQVGPLSDGQHKFVKVIKSNVDCLTNLVNDLLDVSRVEAGHMTLDLQPLDIAPLIKEVLESLTHQIQTKDFALTTNIPDNLPKA